MSTLWQITRFIITGTLTAIIYLSLSYVFVSVLAIHYLIAATLVYVLAVAFNFTVQKVWSFGETTMHRIPLQMAQFALWALISLAGNIVLIYLMVEVAHIWYLYAQAAAVVLVAGASYFVYRYIFRSQPFLASR